MKITSILTGPIKLPMIFFAPEGGGASAVSDPPAAAAVSDDPALVEANADLLGFKPPGMDDIDFGEKPVAPGKDDPKPGDDAAKAKADADRAAAGKAAADKKAADDKAAADAKAKADAGDGEVPLDLLRTAYLATKAELAALKETASKGDPRVKELEAERDAQKAEIETARKEIEERKAREMENDPEVLKPLATMDKEYDDKASRFYDRVENITHEQVKALLPKFGAIKKGTDGWEARRDEFKTALNKALGAEGEETHPDFDRTREWIADTFDFATKRNGLVADIKKNAASKYHEAQSKSYSTRKAEVARLLEAAKTVPEGMEKTMPSHPKVVLKAVLSSLKEEQVAALTKGVPEFIELAVLGVPPRTEKDYMGMSPDEIASARAKENAQVEAARSHLPDVVYNGMIALRVVGALMRDNAKLRERLGEKRESDPPNPDGDGKDGKQTVEGDGLKDFRPPSLDHMNY